MTDKSLEQCVRSALEWEPSLDASDIGISVHEDIVTLRGYVGSYAQKMMAEQVALRVYGVRGVANDIDVHVLSGFQRTDTELAHAAVTPNAFGWRSMRAPNMPYVARRVDKSSGRASLANAASLLANIRKSAEESSSSTPFTSANSATIRNASPPPPSLSRTMMLKAPRLVTAPRRPS